MTATTLKTVERLDFLGKVDLLDQGSDKFDDCEGLTFDRSRKPCVASRALNRNGAAEISALLSPEIKEFRAIRSIRCHVAKTRETKLFQWPSDTTDIPCFGLDHP